MGECEKEREEMGDRKKGRGRVIGMGGRWERGFGTGEGKEEYCGDTERGMVKRDKDDWGRVESSNRNRGSLGQR